MGRHTAERLSFVARLLYMDPSVFPTTLLIIQMLACVKTVCLAFPEHVQYVKNMNLIC